MDGEDSATANPGEDISKWSVEDVCGFISSLAGCAEYTQVRIGGGRGGGEEGGEGGGRSGWGSSRHIPHTPTLLVARAVKLSARASCEQSWPCASQLTFA